MKTVSLITINYPSPGLHAAEFHLRTTLEVAVVVRNVARRRRGMFGAERRPPAISHTVRRLLCATNAGAPRAPAVHHVRDTSHHLCAAQVLPLLFAHIE